MLVVPATIACADVGDLERAATQFARAEDAGTRWPGTAWQAAILEAQAHVARADARRDQALELFARAADLFERAGQPLDASRCRS